MQEKPSNFDKRSAIEKPSLEEVGYEHLRDAKRGIKKLERKIYDEVEKYIEQQVKPHEDITDEEMKELKQHLFETYKGQRVEPLKEDAKVYEESLQAVIDKEGRVIRKLEEAEREFEGISEFELKTSFEKALRDIRSEKGEKA